MKTKGSTRIRITRVAIVLAASGFMGLGYAQDSNGGTGTQKEPGMQQSGSGQVQRQMHDMAHTMQDMANRMETGRMSHQEMQAMADHMRQMSKQMEQMSSMMEGGMMGGEGKDGNADAHEHEGQDKK